MYLYVPMYDVHVFMYDTILIMEEYSDMYMYDVQVPMYIVHRTCT